jgi:tRNA nucleotidyltransferase (CCA-adding enzyme)
MDDRPSPLSPKSWPFSLKWLPQTAHMVGGAVRDALLGRSAEYLDLDFVLPSDAIKTAREIATYYKAGFVVLDADRNIARVVFKQATADFAQQEGASLETDLNRRDFTVNAIAYNPHNGELIDPLQGYTDLQAGVIRMVSPKNLQDDPLRLLRGYRQAAQLGFVIDAATQATIRQLAPLLGEVSAERVLAELRYLLRTPKGTPWLIAACEDGLLSPWFNFGDVSKLVAVDSAAGLLGETWPQLQVELLRSLRETINTCLLGIAKLVILLPPTPEEAQNQMSRLTYSNAEIRAVTTAIAYLPQLQALATSEMSLPEQYLFFQNVGAVFPALALLAVASETPMDAIAPLINRYLDPEDLVAHPTHLVNGTDLIKALNIPPSPQVGQLLTAIALARIEGKISTSTEALEFAAQLVEKQ